MKHTTVQFVQMNGWLALAVLIVIAEAGAIFLRWTSHTIRTLVDKHSDHHAMKHAFDTCPLAPHCTIPTTGHCACEERLAQ